MRTMMALARTVANGFLADMPRQFASLREALTAQDRSELERLAHAMKGAAANVGGERLRRVAERAESLARDGDMEGLGALLSSVELEIEELRAAMTARGLASRPA